MRCSASLSLPAKRGARERTAVCSCGAPYSAQPRRLKREPIARSQVPYEALDPQAFRHSEIRLSSADDPHPAKADSAARAPSTDARVTSEQIRASLRLLTRQIVRFAQAIMGSAVRRGQIWWRALRAAIPAAGASLADRWPGLQERLRSSVNRPPGLGPRVKTINPHLPLMPKAWRKPRGLEVPTKTPAG